MLRSLRFYLRGAAVIGAAAVIASATQALADSTGVLRGQLSDIETHQLVSDATVRLVADNGSAYQRHSDKHGYYTFIGVEPGVYDVEFSHSGYFVEMEYGVVVCPSGSTLLDAWLQSVHSNRIYDRFFYGHSLTTYGLTGGGYFQDFNSTPVLTSC